jgi:NADPH-dependent 2,4-dienoyl-CoA reductase/sulfur reductase-like enzyme
MKNNLNLVVVGGAAAGPTAASTAQRKDPNTQITLLEKGDFISYSAWSLPFYIGDVIKDYNKLVVRTPKEFKEKQQIDIRLRHQALALDRNKKQIWVLDSEKGEKFNLPYDRLILATGARSRSLGIPGEEARNIFTLKKMSDGLQIRHFIDQLAPKKAVIIGAGYISLEVAEALRDREIETTLLYRGKFPYSGLEPELGPIIVKELETHGVRYIGEVQPKAFETLEGKAQKLVTDQEEYPADLFFVGVGIVPNIELAREAGIIIGKTGGIQVNPFMQTSDPDIWAAGDCCETLNRVTDQRTLAPLGDVANKEGRVAGENSVGGRAEFLGVVGAASVKVFDLEIGMAGISEAQAKKMGFSVISQTVEAFSRNEHYPGTKPTLLKIIADQSSGRILGGNWIGWDGEARKINALAVALHQKMTLDDISTLDLAYSPPFSPTMDPLLIAANLLKRKVETK